MVISSHHLSQAGSPCCVPLVAVIGDDWVWILLDSWLILPVLATIAGIIPHTTRIIIKWVKALTKFVQSCITHIMHVLYNYYDSQIHMLVRHPVLDFSFSHCNVNYVTNKCKPVTLMNNAFTGSACFKHVGSTYHIRYHYEGFLAIVLHTLHFNASIKNVAN